MENLKSVTEVSRRKFLRNVALGSAGATLLDPSDARANDRQDSACDALPHVQAEREEFENLCRAILEAYDSLDLESYLSFQTETVSQQDATIGDLEVFAGNPPSAQCSVFPRSRLEVVLHPFFEHFRVTTGGLSKFMYASGSTQYGGAADTKVLANTYFRGGLDELAYFEMNGGKLSRRNDYWDSAQLTPEDIAFLHPGGVPRRSCEPGPVSGEVANATNEMVAYARALHGALSAGDVGRVLQFFDDSALLIHPLLHTGPGTYGPFNRGIKIQGQRAIGRFFRAVLPVLPDGKNSTLVHITGASTGGAFEWKAAGIYANQGLARTGISGATAIDLFGSKIQRMSVKFDTLQMTPQQRAAFGRALAGECLVVS
jgi:hypothetical protein